MGNTANIKSEPPTRASTIDHALPGYRWLGQQAYAPFLEEMQQHARTLAGGKGDEVVWFCEHQPVYTTGKRGINNTVSQLKAPLVVTDRGGETTFHGTGQLMMYPIIRLKDYRLSVRDYVAMLEESCILLLKTCQLQAERDCGLPGVWLEQEKIAALGIRISRGIASHGIALNVNTNLLWFDHINPCGTSRKATSIAAQTGREFPLELLATQWFAIFCGLLKA